MMTHIVRHTLLLLTGILLLGSLGAHTAQAVCYVKWDAEGANSGIDWTNAYTDLQSALTNSSCAEIWVAQGIYTPGTDRTATFQLKSGVALYGGFAGTESSRSERDGTANLTTLSGDLDGNDGLMFDDNDENSYHVVSGNGTDNSAILDGFTISCGNADGTDPDNSGGGMFNNSGSPTVTNCTFSGNSAENDGGGMQNSSCSSPTVTNCTFSGNSVTDCGGGMGNSENSSPAVTNCTFSGNSAFSGGGMVNDLSSSPTVVNGTFSSNSTNYGGGMFNANSSSPTMTNCTFRGNIGKFGGGGMINYLSSSPTLTNCTFSGNSAFSGGGMNNSDSSSPTLTNCTFSGNVADDSGGGMDNSVNSSPTVTNSIFWGNTPAQQISNDTSTPAITYSDVQGGYDGTGNIDADPLFVSMIHGNLRLQLDSPVINKGNSEALPPDTTDLDRDGNSLEPLPHDLDSLPRVLHSSVDMGAYEQQHNNTPEINQGSLVPVSMSEDGSPVAWTSPILTATDEDGDSLTWNLAIAASHGTAVVSGTDTSPATFTYTPDKDYNGTDLLMLEVSDYSLSDSVVVSVTVTPVNDTPTNLSLSNSQVARNEDAGTPIGTLTTTDPDSSDTSFAYTLVDGVTGCDGTDNESFQISGDELQTSTVFDYEAQNSYAICVQTADGNGGVYHEAFTISITDDPGDNIHYLLWTK